MNLEKEVEVFVPIDQDIIDLMLKEYYPTCRHTISPEIKAPEETSGAGLTLQTKLYIDHCYYGNGPGHFNATEFIVCMNQSIYLIIGSAIKNKMLPNLRMQHVEEWKEAQMNRVHIGNISMRFKKEINPKDFNGKLRINKAKYISGKAFYKFSMNVYDELGGSAYGESNVSITQTTN